MKTVMRRGCAAGITNRRIANMLVWFGGCKVIEGLHPLESGLFRMRSRLDRRPGLPTEAVIPFYARYAWETASKYTRFLSMYARLRFFSWRLDRDPNAVNYRDAANAPTQTGT